MLTLNASHPPRRMPPDVWSAVMEQVSKSGFIRFYPAFASRLGFKAALFLGHALYWTQLLAEREPKRGGWFYLYAEDWQRATGLTKREQASVRALLKKERLLDERLRGHPARLYFHVDLARLAQWIGLDADMDGNMTLTWEQFAPWLHSSVSFYRPLADVAGSVSAGLYLSYLLRLRGRQMSADEHGEVTLAVSRDAVQEALCLSVKAQRTVREKLAQRDLIASDKGTVRLFVGALMRALQERPSTLALGPIAHHTTIEEAGINSRPAALSRPALSAGRSSGAPSNQPRVTAFLKGGGAQQLSLLLADDRQALQRTISAATAFLSGGAPLRAEQATRVECEKGTSSALLSLVDTSSALSSPGMCPFVTSHVPFCNPHINTNTKGTTTAARVPAREAVLPDAHRRRVSPNTAATTGGKDAQHPDSPRTKVDKAAEERLILPTALPPELHAAALATVKRAPRKDRQRLLDELQGQMGCGSKVIANPVGYLHVLVQRHSAGNLVLAMADQVAEVRAKKLKEKQRTEAAFKAPIATEKPARKQEPTPVSESVQTARAKLRALAKQMAVGGARR